MHKSRCGRHARFARLTAKLLRIIESERKAVPFARRAAITKQYPVPPYYAERLDIGGGRVTHQPSCYAMQSV